MFGLEEQDKKKPTQDVFFELENELKDTRKHREIKLKCEQRVKEIKESLRSGENKEEFDQFGVLLHGYTSLLKVISRYSTSK